MAEIRAPADIVEWAERELTVLDGPLVGQRLVLEPFQREIARSLTDPAVHDVSCMGSSQWGKTLIFKVWLGWTVVESPARMLYVLPTLTDAQAFSRERINVLFEQPAFAGRVNGRRSSGGSNTVLGKTFPGGSVTFTGATSRGGTAQRAVPRVCMDELDKWAGKLGDEGSPESAAAQRTETFENAVIYRVSSPTAADSPIHRAFLAGDRRRWHVRCPACPWRGHLTWEMVHWESRDGSDAALHCPECGSRWTEAARLQAIAGGCWVSEVAAAGDPVSAGRHSYHVWSAMSSLSRLPALAAKHIEATAALEAGDPEKLRTFRQSSLGLPVAEDDIVAGDVDRLRAALLAGREGIASWSVPSNTRLVGSVDVHGDRLELLVSAWTATDVWLVAHRVIRGSTSEADVWELLADALEEADYAGQSVEVTGIDSGYLPRRVYDFCIASPRRRRALKGYAGPRPLVGKVQPIEKGLHGRKCLVWPVGVDEAKRRLRSMLEGGRVHLPRAPWCGEELIAQLTAEQEQTVLVRGRSVRRWVPLRKRNEMTDLAVYSLHGFLTLR